MLNIPKLFKCEVYKVNCLLRDKQLGPMWQQRTLTCYNRPGAERYAPCWSNSWETGSLPKNQGCGVALVTKKWSFQDHTIFSGLSVFCHKFSPPFWQTVVYSNWYFRFVPVWCFCITQAWGSAFTAFCFQKHELNTHIYSGPLSTCSNLQLQARQWGSLVPQWALNSFFSLGLCWLCLVYSCAIRFTYEWPCWKVLALP